MDTFRDVIASGVVLKITKCAISVTFLVSDAHGLYFDRNDFCILLSPTDVTFKRREEALDMLKNYKSYTGRHFPEYFFGNSCFSDVGIEEPDLKRFFDSSLNNQQKQAVKFCFNRRRKFSIIHGPPGTDKTTTIVEIIRQAIKVKQSYFVPLQETVRLGVPVRFHAEIAPYCLDSMLKKNHSYNRFILKARTDMNQLLRHQNNLKSIMTLEEEQKALESQAFDEILDRVRVVCCTLTSATPTGPLGKLVPPAKGFDLVVIDECSQAPEIACWPALLYASRCVIAGDNRQLGPAIFSDVAVSKGLGRSLVDRLMKQFDPSKFVQMLTVQYRMHEKIMTWSSAIFYEKKLVAHESNRQHLLTGLPNVVNCEETSIPLWFINTAGCGIEETLGGSDISKANAGEVQLTYLHCQKLIESGVRPEDIIIISPYCSQVNLIKIYIGGIYEGLKIGTVDGFQGQEAQAVVLSLVRSNPNARVGFLSDMRRINVAVTRAKRHLCLIGDERTVRSDMILQSLTAYIAKHGKVRSAAEYQELLRTVPFSKRLLYQVGVRSSNGIPVAFSDARGSTSRSEGSYSLDNRVNAVEAKFRMLCEK